MWLPILLILIITGAAWLLNKILLFKLCPVCAGVSGAWIILTVLVLGNVIPASLFILPVSILMGGTVVGIAYQGEKSLLWVRRYPVAWKLTVMVVGFPLVYGVVQYMSWTAFGIELALLMVLVYTFFVRRAGPVNPHMTPRGEAQDVKIIEKGLEQCC